MLAKILINIVIFFAVAIGFFIFLGKSYGWFKEGGLVYEWWMNKKRERKKRKEEKKASKQ